MVAGTVLVLFVVVVVADGTPAREVAEIILGFTVTLCVEAVDAAVTRETCTNRKTFPSDSCRNAFRPGPAGLLNAGPGCRAGAGPPGPGQARRARAEPSAPPKTAGLQLARQVRAEPPRAGKDCLALKRLDRARA